MGTSLIRNDFHEEEAFCGKKIINVKNVQPTVFLVAEQQCVQLRQPDGLGFRASGFGSRV